MHLADVQAESPETNAPTLGKIPCIEGLEPDAECRPASSSVMLGMMAPVCHLFLMVVHLYWAYTGCVLKQILEAGEMPQKLGVHTSPVEDASLVPSTDFGCFISTYNSSSRETPCLWPLKASELTQSNQSIKGMSKLSCPQPQHEALDKCLG